MSGRRDIRGATLLLLLPIGTVGCAKLNAAYSQAEDGTTSGASVDVTTGSTADEVTSDVDASEGTSGHESGSVTGATTTGGGSSGDVGSGTTGSWPPPDWTPECGLELETTPCPQASQALDVGDRATCGLGPFLADGGNECRRENTASVSLNLDEGTYIIGTLPALDAQMVVDDGQTGPTCMPRFGRFAVEAPEQVEVSVRTNEGFVDAFAVRNAAELCTVPPDCCEPTDERGEDSCSNVGLVGCVIVHDIACVDTWDLLCVQTAVLFCGADCEGAF